MSLVRQNVGLCGTELTELCIPGEDLLISTMKRTIVLQKENELRFYHITTPVSHVIKRLRIFCSYTRVR